MPLLVILLLHPLCSLFLLIRLLKPLAKEVFSVAVFDAVDVAQLRRRVVGFVECEYANGRPPPEALHLVLPVALALLPNADWMMFLPLMLTKHFFDNRSS